MAQRSRLAGENLETDVDAVARCVQRAVDDPVASYDGARLDAAPREVERAAFTGPRAHRRPVLRMDAANAGFVSARCRDQALPGARDPCVHGSRDHEPGALEHECAVHAEAEATVRGPRREAQGARAQRTGEGVHPVSGQGRDLMDLGALHAGGREERVDLLVYLAGPGRVDLVDLAHHRDAFGHPEQVENRGVLTGLGHHAVVGGDHHQREVDGSDPRQHVAHEPFVSGHVDEPEHVTVAEGVVCEPEIDGQPSLLLFGEAIRVHTGQRPHQRGLAVVDVTRGGDDHGAARRSSCATKPAA